MFLYCNLNEWFTHELQFSSSLTVMLVIPLRQKWFRVNYISILCALTRRDWPYTAFGTTPGNVGGVDVTVVGCRRWQAVHLSFQGCEGLVVFDGINKQRLRKQGVAVRPQHVGPLKLYRRTWNSFGIGDLRCGGHCGNVTLGIQGYSTVTLYLNASLFKVCLYLSWLFPHLDTRQSKTQWPLV